MFCVSIFQIDLHIFLYVPDNYPLARAWLCYENCFVKGWVPKLFSKGKAMVSSRTHL